MYMHPHLAGSAGSSVGDRFYSPKEHLAMVLEYFKTRKPELYEKYMDGVTFYRSEYEEGWE